MVIAISKGMAGIGVSEEAQSKCCVIWHSISYSPEAGWLGLNRNGGLSWGLGHYCGSDASAKEVAAAGARTATTRQRRYANNLKAICVTYSMASGGKLIAWETLRYLQGRCGVSLQKPRTKQKQVTSLSAQSCASWLMDLMQIVLDLVRCSYETRHSVIRASA